VGILSLKKFLLLNLTFSAGIFFYSCSDREPVGRDKMVRIYTDLLLAQDSLTFKSNVPGKNALQDSVKQGIFRKYNVSSADYENTINYYNENPEYWESFFTRTTVYLDSLKKAADR
jgi:hypothetical protein